MKTRWHVWAVFGMLWLIAGSAWIEGQYWSSPLTLLPRLAFEDALVAVLFGASVLIRRPSPEMPESSESGRRGRERMWVVLLWGSILFALPTLVAAGARGHVEQFTSALIYTLVPTMVIVLAGRRSAGFGVQDSPPVLPAVAAAGGAALLLPFVTPESATGFAWLGAVVVSAILCALAAVELNRRLDRRGALQSTALLAAVSAVLAAVAAGPALAQIAALRGWDLGLEVLRSLLIGAPTMGLTLWLLPRISPVAFSARYLAVPLLTVAEGLVLLRPEVTWTTPVALLLMAFGSWRLLRVDGAFVSGS